MSDFNDRIITEFRENNGDVERFGKNLVILHSVGAKSGEPRTNPVLSVPRGRGWVVVASKAGAPTHPAWYFNLLANPDIAIEALVDDTIRTVDVHARELEGRERQSAWDEVVSLAPGFADYEVKAAPRVIPLFELDRR